MPSVQTNIKKNRVVLHEIRDRLRSLKEVSKRNGSINGSEDVRKVFMEFNAGIPITEEESIRNIKILAVN